MDNPRGRVITVSGAAASRHALVEVDEIPRCERCAQGKGCGAALLGGTPGPRQVDALVGAGVSVAEGDEVRIQLAPRHVLHASVIVYGTPLFAAIGAALIAYVAGLGDLYASMACIAGLLLGVQLARLQLKKSSCLQRFTPIVVERLTLPGV